MTSKVSLAIAAVVLQLLIAFAPFMPVVKELVNPQGDAEKQFEIVLTMIGVSFAVMTAYMGIVFLVEHHDEHEFQEDLKRALPETRIEKLRDDEFLDQFYYRASRAESYVYIAYFAPYPPQDIHDTKTKNYHKRMLELIRKHTEVHFRRLVRATPKNAPWIDQLVNELEGLPNVDVYLLEDSGEEEMPLALSVQIIDDKYTWLVALEGHERTGTFRDVSIDSAKLAEAMIKYYERLWRRAKPVLSKGRNVATGKTA